LGSAESLPHRHVTTPNGLSSPPRAGAVGLPAALPRGGGGPTKTDFSARAERVIRIDHAPATTGIDPLPRMREAGSLQRAELPKVRRSSAASSRAAKPPHVGSNHGGVWLCWRTIWISAWRKHLRRYPGRLRIRDGRRAGRSAYWLRDQSDSRLTPISPWVASRHFPVAFSCPRTN
jgi:hypothetical protein